MANIGLIIVGDEILSGRRTDRHLSKVVEMLAERGLTLGWVRIVGDDKALLDETFRQSLASGDIVFSTGGIGATPDDMTRESVARALGVSTVRHPEGVKILEQFACDRGRKLTDESYRLIEFPQGATLIPNSVNTIPGFSVGDHHFVPGFPEMAWAMIAWVLDNRYPHIFQTDYVEVALLVKGVYENKMIPVMESMSEQFPDVKMFCLPSMGNEIPINEIGLKGQKARVDLALTVLCDLLDEKKYQWEMV